MRHQHQQPRRRAQHPPCQGLHRTGNVIAVSLCCSRWRSSRRWCFSFWLRILCQDTPACAGALTRVSVNPRVWFSSSRPSIGAWSPPCYARRTPWRIFKLFSSRHTATCSDVRPLYMILYRAFRTAFAHLRVPPCISYRHCL